MTPLRCCFLHPLLVLISLVLCGPAGLAAQSAPVVGRIAPAPKTLSTSAIAALATPATVTILTLSPTGDTLGQGSGFLVRSTGIVVTNWHVMAGASEAVVILADGEHFTRVQALDADEAIDVALLKVPGYGLPALVPSGTIPAIGAKVIAIGSPRGLARTVTEGIVSAKRLVEGRELVQVSASISPGSSGGPVLDDRGRVFAIATSQISDGQQLNFAVPVRYALGLIPDVMRPRPLAELFVHSAGPSLAGNQSRPLPDRSVPYSASSTLPLISSVDDPLLTAFFSSATVVPPSSATPRPVVTGFYVLREDLRWPDLHRSGLDTFRLTDFGAVVIAGDNSGYVLRNHRSGDSPGWVQPFSDLNAAPDGRVVLRIDGGAFNGYQTKEGIFLYNRQADGDGDTVESRIRLMAVNNSLSNPNGLYQVKVRTLFHSQASPGGYTEWAGDAAVITANDSVFIDLTLGNENGGNTGGFLRGSIDGEGTFSAQDRQGGLGLEGTIRAGILRAGWTDRRKDGKYFDGDLTGVRR